MEGLEIITLFALVGLAVVVVAWIVLLVLIPFKINKAVEHLAAIRASLAGRAL